MVSVRTNLDNTRERARQLRFEPTGSIAATNVQGAIEQSVLNQVTGDLGLVTDGITQSFDLGVAA